MFFAILVALLLLLAGATALVAARVTSPTGARRATEQADELSAPERLAVRLTEGVGRTALAVDVLVDRRPSEDVLRERGSDLETRRLDLVVVGAGLLGLGVVMSLGVVLLLV